VKAVVLKQPGEVEIRDFEDPTPSAGQIVVRVGACGVCGTDLHIADGEFPPTPYPIIPGHEFAGEVVAVGPNVPTSLAALGDRMAVDPSLFCGYCAPCRAGHGNLCKNWNAIGDTVNGAFAEYVAVPAANAYHLPDSLDYFQGALVEPLSCAVHGMDRIGAVLGQRVLVMGAGTMGLLLQQLLIRAGAAAVAVVDRSPARLEVAALLGAEVVATDADDLDGATFDVSVDATGAAGAIAAAFDRLARGGRLLVFGVASADAVVALSPFRIYNDELTILGSMAVLHSFTDAVELMAAGVIDTDAFLRTPPRGLEGYEEALMAVRRGEGIKVQVDPSKRA
jgi:2-desacetyl-2-hydroxyethyl bacteriochlorophyllide A dehydrogenase